MGTDGTNRSHAWCHPYPIQQPVKVGHTHRCLRPLLFSNSGAGSFTSHKNRSVKCCETGATAFFLKCEKTRESNHLQISLQKHHFLLSYLKTLSVGPARIWTRDLPLGRRRFPNRTYHAWRFAQGWKLKILIPCWKSQYFYSFRYRSVLCVNKNINA